MSLVANERVKLTVGLLNTIAGFSVTAGGVAPLIAVSFGVTAAPTLGAPSLILLTLVWIGVGTTLHVLARRLLGGLVS